MVPDALAVNLHVRSFIDNLIGLFGVLPLPSLVPFDLGDQLSSQRQVLGRQKRRDKQQEFPRVIHSGDPIAVPHVLHILAANLLDQTQADDL